MTALPSPPSRRRRRIVVAVTLLMFTSLCTWWYWRRGDARFVGKWTHSSYGELGGAFRFRRNGVLEMYGVGVSIDAKTGEEITQISESRIFSTWSVSGDKLPIGHREPPAFVAAVLEYVESYVPIPWLIGGGQARIVKVSDNEITLDVEGDEATLIRIPE
jgi:hypothetical protein